MRWGPQDLITASLCIQIVIDKMVRCSLSLVYDCPYHGALCSQRWQQQTTRPHNVCPVHLKPGFIYEEHLPTEVGYEDPGEDDKHADELPWECFWQFVQKLFGCANPVSAVLWLADLRRYRRCRRQMWRSWAGVVTRGLLLWGRLDILPNSLKQLETRCLMVDIKLSGGHSCSQHANCMHPELETSVALCDKTAHFREAFYWSKHKVHLCNDHAV